MRRGHLAFAAISFTAACARESRFIPLEPGAGALTFAVTVDSGTGTRTKILTTRPLQGPLHETIADSERVVLIRASRESIARFHCRVDLSRLDEARLGEKSAACGQATEVADDGLAVLRELDGDTLLELTGEDGDTFEGERARVLGGLSLELFLEPPPETGGAIRPFGGTAALLPRETLYCNETWPPGTGEDRAHRYFEAAEYVDEDRVLAISGRNAFLFDRGGTFSDTAGRRLCSRDLEPPNGFRDWRNRDLAYLGPGEDGAIHFLVAGAHDRGDEDWGAILELAVDSGGVRLVRTATITRRPLLAIAVDISGAVTAVGGKGWVVSSTSARGAWSAQSASPNNFEAVAAAHDSEKTFFLAGEEAFVYRAARGPAGIEITREQLDLNVRPNVTSVATTGNGQFVWASVLTGIRRAAPESRFESVETELARPSASCTQAQTCGRAFGSVDPRELTAISRSRVAFAVSACGSIVVLDEDPACGRAHVVPTPIDSPTEVRDLSARDGRLLIAGADGLLMELDTGGPGN